MTADRPLPPVRVTRHRQVDRQGAVLFRVVFGVMGDQDLVPRKRGKIREERKIGYAPGIERRAKTPDRDPVCKRAVT